MEHLMVSTQSWAHAQLLNIKQGFSFLKAKTPYLIALKGPLFEIRCWWHFEDNIFSPSSHSETLKHAKKIFWQKMSYFLWLRRIKGSTMTLKRLFEKLYLFNFKSVPFYRMTATFCIFTASIKGNYILVVFFKSRPIFVFLREKSFLFCFWKETVDHT
jgi:hypothetical protein